MTTYVARKTLDFHSAHRGNPGQPTDFRTGKTLSSVTDFDTFYRSQFGRLSGALRVMCGDQGTAEELAQEAFVKAYSKWDKVVAHPNPEGWLFTTGYNLAKRRWRFARRTDLGIDESQMSAGDEPSFDNSEMMAAIAKLPIKQRAAVTARYVLGYSGDEAAELLGMSPSNLRVTLHRATATLRLDPSFLSAR